MKNYKSFSDPELITRMKNGDHLAYSEVYDRYFYLLFLFAYKKLRDEDMSKDFVQDLFMKVWKRKASISESGKLSSFLYISIRIRIFDHFARHKVENKYLSFLKNFVAISLEGTDYQIRLNNLAYTSKRR